MGLFKNKKNNNTEEEEKKPIKKSLKYRELAEYVLQRFKVKKVEEKSDEELLMEFSKLSDPNAEFDFNINYPSGSLRTRRVTSRIDGIIWRNKYAPDFVKAVVSDKEFLDIWLNERNKKVSQEAFIQEAFTPDKILEKILARDSEFSESTIKNNETINKINLTNLMNIIQQEYQKEIEEGLGISIPDIVTILNIIAEMNYFNDFSDLCVKSEQEITNDYKVTYVEFSESENIDVNDIINNFEDIDDDDIFDKEDEDDDDDKFYDDDL